MTTFVPGNSILRCRAGCCLARAFWRIRRRFAGAFLSTDEGEERPDAQIHFAAAASRPNKNGWMIPIPATTAAICIVRPCSRGSSHIESTDPNRNPKIQPNYLSHSDDRKRSIRALRILRDILKTSPFSDQVSAEIRPGPDVESDEELLSYIRHNGESVHHSVGTCKMGDDNDENAVVDDQLRVRGVQGLRIADASIMPTVPSGNTHAACVMIAEKAADLITLPFARKMRIAAQTIPTRMAMLAVGPVHDAALLPPKPLPKSSTAFQQPFCESSAMIAKADSLIRAMRLFLRVAMTKHVRAIRIPPPTKRKSIG